MEQKQVDARNGKTAKPRPEGRGGKTSGGASVAGRVWGTLQAVIGYAKHEGLLDEHPTKGAKRLKTKKRDRRLSVAEVEASLATVEVDRSENMPGRAKPCHRARRL